jgi:hypothetical protein
MQYRTQIANKALVKGGPQVPVNGVRWQTFDSLEDALANVPETVLLKAIHDQFASWALNWARGEKSVLAEGKLLTYTPSATGGSNVDENSLLASLKA